MTGVAVLSGCTSRINPVRVPRVCGLSWQSWVATPPWCVPLRKCGRTVPVFQPEPAPIAALTRGLRQKFDPRGILNPGLMGA